MDEIRIGSVHLVQAGDHVTDYRESGEEVVQTQRPMRSPVARVVRRGGALTTISFTVVRDHENHVAARSHIRAQRRALLAETATAVEYAAHGAGVSAGRLVDAAVQMTEGRARGIQSIITWTITGAEEIPE